MRRSIKELYNFCSCKCCDWWKVATVVMSALRPTSRPTSTPTYSYSFVHRHRSFWHRLCFPQGFTTRSISDIRQLMASSPNLSFEMKLKMQQITTKNLHKNVPVEQPLLLDHCQVAFPALPLRPIVIPHGSRHFLIIHSLRPGW